VDAVVGGTFDYGQPRPDVAYPGIALRGIAPGQFAFSEDRGKSLASHATCTLKARFTPCFKGTKIACLNLSGGGEDLRSVKLRNHPICPPDNTPELLIPEFNYWGWIQRATARIRYGGRKRRLYTDGPRTCGPCNCYSAIPSLRVPSGIWESKWMTCLKWQSKLTFDDAAPVGGAGRRPATKRHSGQRNHIRKAAVHFIR
jgi:hypothetical protein